MILLKTTTSSEASEPVGSGWKLLDLKDESANPGLLNICVYIIIKFSAFVGVYTHFDPSAQRQMRRCWDVSFMFEVLGGAVVLPYWLARTAGPQRPVSLCVGLLVASFMVFFHQSHRGKCQKNWTLFRPPYCAQVAAEKRWKKSLMSNPRCAWSPSIPGNPSESRSLSGIPPDWQLSGKELVPDP